IDQIRNDPTVERIQAFGAMLLSNQGDDLSALATLARDELKLPWDWVPVPLLALYRMAAFGEARGVPMGFGLRAPETALPGGRHARRSGADIVRNTHWYYRLRIKHPRDKVKAIAREYAVEASRRTDARSVVQNGVKQAAALLELVVARAE